MKKTVFVFLILIVQNSFAQYPYPHYLKVHKEFYSKYTDDMGGFPVYTSFEKRKDGWYVQYTTAENFKDKKHVLFWEKVTNQWNPLGFDKAITNYKPISEFQIPYMYRVSPLYGYNGWYKDVIDSLGNKEKLSDTLLYALDKAYYNYFASAFGNQYGDFLSDDVLSSGTYPNTFDVNELPEIRNRSKKVVETTQRIQQQNPRFETFIGSLSMQYGNDVMDMYMRMYLYQDKEEAAKFMQTNLYDPYILDFAKYLLMSCPANSILFTKGDNDTYPLWYVQYGLGIRTDVSVVNLSLLNHPAYASMVRKQGIVQFSTPEKNLNQEGFGYALVTNFDKKLYQKDIMDFLNQDFSDKNPKTLNGGTFVFDLNGKEWEVRSLSYIYMGDLMVMDIIYSNAGKRPICFAASTTIFKGLMDPDLQFTQVKTIGVSVKDQTEALLQMWNKGFSLSDYSGFKDHFSASHNRLVGSMVYDVAAKAKFLIRDGRLKEAEQIVIKLITAFKSFVVKKDRSWLEAAAIIGKSGNSKLAGEMVDEIIQNERQEMIKDKNMDIRLLDNLQNSKNAIMDGSYLNMN